MNRKKATHQKLVFFDRDEIPVYENIIEDIKNWLPHKEYKFSGKRVKRGLYQTKDGKLLNADVNGALNILSKSKVVGLDVLYNRGELDTPIRIRVA